MRFGALDVSRNFFGNLSGAFNSRCAMFAMSAGVIFRDTVAMALSFIHGCVVVLTITCCFKIAASAHFIMWLVTNSASVEAE